MNSWLTAPVELVIDQTPRARWQALTDAALAPMQQRWAYGAAVAAMGGRVTRVDLRDNGETVALAQVVTRRIGVAVSLVTLGPVWMRNPHPEARARAIRALKKVLRGVVAITPSEAASETMRQAGMWKVMTPATLTELTLEGNLRDRLHGKWRNRLVRAEVAGLALRVSRNPEDLHWLLDADKAQQRVRGYRALPPAFTECWRRHDRKSVLMLIAERDGVRLAAMLFLVHGTTATYHVGWTGAAGREVSAHNLLLWESAIRLTRQGVRRLDLGTIDTENAPGLARFKLGTGAVPVPTGGTWLGW